MPIVKLLQFSEGVSVSAPTSSTISASGFQTYADDAAYVTAKGSAAADGDSYYNTTSDIVRLYENGAWTNVATQGNALTLTNKILSDDSTYFGDSGDLTKKLEFELAGATTAKTMTVASSHTDNRTLTLPDATDTLIGKATTDTLTNKTLTTPALTSPAINTSVTGDAFLDEDDMSSNSATKLASQQSIKAYSDNLPATQANTFAIGDNADTDKTFEADNGDVNNPKIRYVSANDRWEFSNDGTTFSAFGSGSGGGITYVSNDFEAGETASITGSTGITAAEETTNPLFGTTSAKISKDAADRSTGTAQIETFTIDEGMQNQILQLACYVSTSANYADEDASFRIYDLENSAYVTMLDGDGLIYANDQGKFFCRFQTSAFGGGGSEGQYRLDLYIESTNATAYDITVDEILINDQQKTYGSPDVYLGALTTTGSWSTNTTYTGTYWRKGGWLHADIKISLSGAPTATSLTINLPAGLSVDTDKLSADTNAYNFGDVSIYDDGVGAYVGTVGSFTLPTTSLVVTYTVAATNVSSFVTQAAPFTFANNDEINIRYEVPISGWSSNVAMSAPDANREISFSAHRVTTDQTLTAGAYRECIFNSKDHDNTNSYDITTGRFTVPVSGKYKFSWAAHLSGATAATNVYGGLFVNQTGNEVGAEAKYDWVNAQIDKISGNYILDVDKGDEVSVMLFITANDMDLKRVASNTGYSYFSGHKINSGSQIIAAEEAVYAHYTHAVADTISDGDTFTATTKVEDSHNAYNTTTGVFTAPKSGRLDISAAFLSSSDATPVAGEAITFEVEINGTVVLYGKRYTGETTAAQRWSADLNASYPVSRGDTVEVLFDHSIGSTISYINNAKYNWLVFKM